MAIGTSTMVPPGLWPVELVLHDEDFMEAMPDEAQANLLVPLGMAGAMLRGGDYTPLELPAAALTGGRSRPMETGHLRSFSRSSGTGPRRRRRCLRGRCRS